MRGCAAPSAPLEPQLTTIIGESGVWRDGGEKKTVVKVFIR